jgi:hypothetical protein
MRDEEGFVWIGVHFGSRGLGTLRPLSALFQEPPPRRGVSPGRNT